MSEEKEWFVHVYKPARSSGRYIIAIRTFKSRETVDIYIEKLKKPKILGLGVSVRVSLITRTETEIMDEVIT